MVGKPKMTMEQFYNSKVWKQTRVAMIKQSQGVCALCGEIIIGSPEVHHKIELNELNISNPLVSLNPDFLEVLHKECHDKRHDRFTRQEKEIIVDDELNIDYSKRR
jgi:5-methylcytosine-specific restriction endonuclease McrA